MNSRWVGLALIFFAFASSIVVAAKPNCDLRAICYALDQSGSISDKHYAVLQRFTVGTARAFAALARDGIRTEYSAVAFSFESLTIAPPTSELEGEFVPAIRGKRKFRSSTNIYSGLRDCFEILQAAPPGARALVLVTDGHHNRGGENPISEIHDADIAVVSVGVGNRVNATALEKYATEPRFFVPATFGNLPHLGAAVVSAACKAAKVIASPKVVIPNTTDDSPFLSVSPEPSEGLVSTYPLFPSAEPAIADSPEPSMDDDDEEYDDDDEKDGTDLLFSPEPSLRQESPEPSIPEETPESSTPAESPELTPVTTPEISMDPLEPSASGESPDVTPFATPELTIEPSMLGTSDPDESSTALDDMTIITPKDDAFGTPNASTMPPSSTPIPPRSVSKPTLTPAASTSLVSPSVSPTITPVTQTALSSVLPMFDETPEPSQPMRNEYTPSTSAILEPRKESIPSDNSTTSSPIPFSSGMPTPDITDMPSSEASVEPVDIRTTPQDNVTETPPETDITESSPGAPTLSSVPEPSWEGDISESPSLATTDSSDSPTTKTTTESLPGNTLTEAPTAALSPSSTSELSYLNSEPDGSISSSVSPSSTPTPYTSPASPTLNNSDEVLPDTLFTTTYVPSTIVVPTTTVSTTLVPVIVQKSDESVGATVLSNKVPTFEVRGATTNLLRAKGNESTQSSSSTTKTPAVKPQQIISSVVSPSRSSSGVGHQNSSLNTDNTTRTRPSSSYPMPSPAEISMAQGCNRAFATCRFTIDFSSTIPSYRIPSVPDKSFTGNITFKIGSSHVAGAVNSGEMMAEFVHDNSKATEITSYGTPKFVASAFKTVALSAIRSGVAHQVFSETQALDVRNRCIRVWFEEYQLLDVKGKMIGNVRSRRKEDGACVVFRTS